MKKLTLVLLMLASALISTAQKGTVYGTVTDAETEETLPFVNIVVGSDKGTTTDIDGKYELQLEPGNHTVEFRFVGYDRDAKRIKIKDGERIELNMKLYSEAKELGIVTVTGSKYEKKMGEEVASVEVLTPQLIKNNMTDASMESALDKVPGVNMLGEQISIRGGSGYSSGAASRVLVLLDGLPLLTPDDANVEFGSMPLENVKQIEVIKGASSALYGSAAMNGIINIRTANPGNEPYNELVLFAGLYENPFKGDKQDLYWRDKVPPYGGMTFAHRKKYGQFDVVMGLSYFRDQNYLFGNEQRRSRLFTKLRYRSKKHVGLTTGVNINVSHKDGGFFFVWGGWGNEGGKADSLAYTPSGGAATFKTIPISIDPYVTYFDKKNNMHAIKTRWYYVNNVNSGGEQSIANMYYGEYTFHSKLKPLGLDFVTGVSGFFSTIEAESFGNHKARNASVFLQIDKKFFDRLTLSAGGRFEHNSIDDTDASNKPVFRAGVNYQVAEATYLRASFGQGYRFPTIAEKFSDLQRSGVPVRPNPALEPESGWSGEIGVKQALAVGETWVGYFDVAGYVQQYYNMIEFTSTPVQAPGNTFPFSFQALNVNDTRISGIDVSLFGSGEIFGIPTNFIVGYTWIKPISLSWNDTIRYYNNEGEQLAGNTYAATSTSDENLLKFRFQHTAKADVETTYKGFTFGLTGTFNSFMENIDLYSNLISGSSAFREANDKGEFVLDARIGYNLAENAKVTVIAKNVTNNQYVLRPTYMEAPRNYTVQLAYEF